jgi:hypothetical protein
MPKGVGYGKTAGSMLYSAADKAIATGDIGSTAGQSAIEAVISGRMGQELVGGQAGRVSTKGDLFLGTTGMTNMVSEYTQEFATQNRLGGLDKLGPPRAAGTPSMAVPPPGKGMEYYRDDNFAPDAYLGYGGPSYFTNVDVAASRPQMPGRGTGRAGGANVYFRDEGMNFEYAPASAGPFAPSASYAAPSPPPISMPAPSVANTAEYFPSIASGGGGFTGGGSMLGAVGTVAAGAMTGGVTSYATGGSFTQGAMAGAAVGFGGGAMARYRIPTMGGAFAAKQLGQAGVTGYSKQIAGFTAGFENPAVRRSVFMGGAALGGFVFGGNRSHKRGFNSRRGNSIGR